MEISQEQAKARLESPENLANKLREFRLGKKKVLDEDNSILTLSHGRGLPRLPDKAVAEIAEKAESGLQTQSEIAEEYGVHQSDIAYIKKTAEEYRKQEAEEKQQFANVKIPKNPEERSPTAQAKEQAIDKLMMAMGLLTEEKLEKAKMRDWAAVTGALAKAHSSLNGNQANANAAQVNLVIYAPEVRSEDSFKVVEIENKP